MDMTTLRDLYTAGRITKHEYIHEMQKERKNLHRFADFLSNSGISKVEITDSQVVMTDSIYGIKMVCDSQDERAIPTEILNFGPYEKKDSDMALKLMEGCDDVFDVGANFGWYSMLWAKTFPETVIHSFEPVPKTYAYLCLNKKLNKLKNIIAYNYGLSTANELLPVSYYPEGSGNASIKQLQTRPSEQVICHFQRLDDLFTTHLDFLKVDVEGAELSVFKGGENAIRSSIPIIFVELCAKWLDKFGNNPNDVFDLLNDWGYRGFVVAQNGKLQACDRWNPNLTEVNFFFLHTTNHASKIMEFS